MQRLATPWRRVARTMTPHLARSVPRRRSAERSNSSSSRSSSNVTGGKKVGGLDQVIELVADAARGDDSRPCDLAGRRPAARALPRPQGNRRASRDRHRQRRPGDSRAGADRLHGGGDRGRHAQRRRSPSRCSAFRRSSPTPSSASARSTAARSKRPAAWE